MALFSRLTRSDAERHQWPVLKPLDRGTGLKSVALNRSVCVVGARVRVHLPLPSTLVSKTHALIVQDGGGVYIRDLASRNRTYVNNRAIRETTLELNDMVRFGDLSFRCEARFEPASGKAIPYAELSVRPNGSKTKQTIPLEHYTYLIGARQGCDLMLGGPGIALSHAIVFARDGKRFLRDLSSGHTTVNGKGFHEVELHAGDDICIGQSRIEYRPAAPITEPEEELVVLDEFDSSHEISPVAAGDSGMPSPTDSDAAVVVPPLEFPWQKDEMQVELADNDIVAHRRVTQRA